MLFVCLSAFFLQIKRSIALNKEKKKKGEKVKLEITKNNQVNKVQQQNQESFDLETKRKIQESLQEIYNKQQQQDANSSKRGKFIKLVYDSEHKRLSFTGRFNKEQVPSKDFITNEVIQGKFSERYSFECYDVTTSTTMPGEEFQTSQPQPSIWERGAADARTILYYLSKDKNTLEVIRNGQPGSTSTTYQINPPLD